MKVTYISTYPPRECGLATFNKNLIGAIASGAGETMASVIAIDAGSNEDEYRYADEVSYVIRQESQDDYVKAAEFINSTDTDVCILQHEFGIFGGDSGIYVLSLINHIEKPLVTILHTVLEKPSGQQKMIIQGLAKRSSRLIVMGRKAIDLLDKIYYISRDKIEFIEHGVPDIDAPAINPLQTDPLFSTRKVLLTFGLISRNKGLETVVRALPEIVERHPEVVYVVLGNTHPGIKRNSGEEYRDYLVQLSGELGVQNNLVFINRFLAEEELVNYLAQADIFVSPYLNEAQITSGTLSYAVGAGAAVIATPYWHAQELLSNGRGLLFNFHDERGLAAAVNELLDDPEKLRDIKTKAYNYGLNLRWPVIGRKYASALRWVIENADFGERIFMQVIDTAVIPEFSLDYVRRLTDHTGIVQHAKYGIPNLKEGYCVDDNSRALIMALMACKSGYKEASELLPVYMSFLHYMQDDSGYFRNFLSASREYLDEKGSEDAFGRTIWALGYLINNAPNHSYSKFGEELFCKAIPHLRGLTHLRGIANTIIGLSYYLRTFPSDNTMMDTLNYLSGQLISAYRKCSDDRWNWFENHLTYDNAILPLSLLHAAEITGNRELLTTAMTSMKFLEDITFNSKFFWPVGNSGWYFRDGEIPHYDQQAIDAMAMALMYGQAYHMLKDYGFLKKIFAVYSWFLGENSLWTPLYDSETKGCADGLQNRGINHNQGAESTLSYLITQLVLLQALNANTQQNDRDVRFETLTKGF